MKDQLKEMTVIIQQSKQPDVLLTDLAIGFKKCCLEVQDLLTEKVVESDSTAKITPCIQYLHHTLVGMCNTLYQQHTTILGIDLLIAPIQQVIDSIEQHYRGALTAHSYVSHYKLHSLKQAIELKKVSLLLYFRKHRVEKKLLLVLAKYQQMIQKMPEISYAQYHYTSILLKELENINFKNAKLTSSDQVILLLIRLNFNYLPFMLYCRSVQMAELDQADCKANKLNVLTSQLKTVRLIHPKLGCALEEAAPSVIEVLSGWITEERRCIETMLEIETPETPLLSDTEKVALNLSVDQLALLLKLFKEQAIFKEMDIAKLLKFVTSNYTTVQGKEISLTSLRNKYYTAESSTISHVKGKLILMVNALNQLK